MRSFQGAIFIGTQKYGERFKSALVNLEKLFFEHRRFKYNWM